MPQSTQSESTEFDEAVTSLLGTQRGADKLELQENVKRVAREFSGRKLEALSTPLIMHLAEVPDSVEALEALLVLGLAHPKFFARHDEKLMGEGRRLAGLLERRGDTRGAQSLLEALAWKNPDDREVNRALAAMMQRTGNADHLIERYLRRAETAIGEGRKDEAVAWLREVLTIDRSRRDVARMIRDLHFDQDRKRRSLKAVARRLLVFLMIIGAIAGAVYRESWVNTRFEAILETESSGLEGKRQRLDQIDELIASNPLWFGAFAASKARRGLRKEIADLEHQAAEEAAERKRLATERLDTADSARIRARDYFQAGNLVEALAQLEIARHNAPEGWRHSPRVEADYAAIQDKLREGAKPEGDAP